VLAGFPTGNLVAKPWVLEPRDLLAPTAQERLIGRYPSIENPNDLELLLQALSRTHPFLELSAVDAGDHVRISGTSARSIGEISIKLTTRNFQNELQSRLYRYIGQVDSPENRSRIELEIKRYLESRGFFRTRIALEVESVKTWQSYRIFVDEDYPCRLNRLVSPFSVPRDATLDIKIGDICDEEEIKQKLLKFEEDVRQLGYKQARILKPRIQYNTANNTGILTLDGSLGDRVTYVVDSPVQKLFSDELGNFDSDDIDPEAMVTEITRRYQTAGYADVEVSPPKRRTEGGDRVTYTYQVEPGPLYLITDVQIEGATVLGKDEVLETMDLVSILKIEYPPLNYEKIREGMESLKSRYSTLGYWDFKVAFPRITKDPKNGTAKLVYVISEGKKRIFDGLLTQGNITFSHEEIRELLPLKTNDALVWADLVQFEQKLRSSYNRAGFLYATFKIDLIQSQGLRDIPTKISLTIEESRRVKIGEITITGLVTTHPVVVQRELRFKTGDWYNPDKIEETRTALVGLGLFSTVNIIPSDSSALAETSENIPYTITVREGKPGSVTFGPGWSLIDGGRYTLESSYNNIGGVGRQVFMKSSFSEQKSQESLGHKTLLGRTITVGYIEPYIFDWPVNGAITVGHKAEAGIGRWDLSRSGEVSLTHTLRSWIPGAKLITFYGQKITIEEAEEAQKRSLVATGDVRTGRVGVGFNFDRRNNLSWPTEGYTFNSEVSWARYYLGGDLQYFRWDFGNNYYYELYKNWVAAVGYSFSAFENVERRGAIPDLLPSSERLYAGGAESNRGFRQNSLGPIFDYYDAEEGERTQLESGGSKRAVYRAELRYQIIQDTMAISGFMDASNTFFSPQEHLRFRQDFARQETEPGRAPATILDNEPYDFSHLLQDPTIIWTRNYTSYGLSLNYLTPLGSFNLSYGIPFKRCPTPDSICDVPRGKSGPPLTSGVFHVNVGATF